MSDTGLDALYRPFPAFSEWATSGVNESLWEDALALLQDRRARSSDKTFQEMVERTLRAAAIGTGAI